MQWRKARTLYEANFGKRVEFVYPIKTKVISLTGERCALSCAHCNKHWLKGMSSKPEIDGDFKSCLISGGCDINGRVPLTENIELIKKLSEQVKLIAHTGLIPEKDVKKIAPFIYAVSFNFVGDNSTIRDVFGLERTVDDFIESYLALKKHIRVFPHITVGLHAGKIDGEYKVLEFLRKFGTKAIVFNVLIPTPGTEYADKKPPKIEEVVKIISYARVNFPDALISLGCMRPGGRYRRELDGQTVGLVNRIVIPADSAEKRAKELNYKTERFEECCIL